MVSCWIHIACLEGGENFISDLYTRGNVLENKRKAVVNFLLVLDFYSFFGEIKFEIAYLFTYSNGSKWYVNHVSLDKTNDMADFKWNLFIKGYVKIISLDLTFIFK